MAWFLNTLKFSWEQYTVGRVSYAVLGGLLYVPSFIILVFQDDMYRGYLLSLLLAHIGHMTLIRARARDFGEDDITWTTFMGVQFVLVWVQMLAQNTGYLSESSFLLYNSLLTLAFLFHNLKLLFAKGKKK